jgi:hypothetical protein
MGRVACDDEASTLCVGCCGITQLSSRITSTPAAGSGAGAGQFSHWPHPGSGASSSGISTMAARSPATGAGAGGTVDAEVAAVVTAAATATSCCDPTAMAVPHGGSVVATALPAARGALDERRLMRTDTSDLSALAGRGRGRSAPPCEREHKIKLQPLEIGDTWGECHLQQTGEAPLSLPRGFGRRDACRCHHCARRHPRGTRRRLCGACGLLH